MKERIAHRHADSPRQTSDLHASRPSGPSGTTPVQRRENPSAAARLAELQASAGNRAVVQMLRSAAGTEQGDMTGRSASSSAVVQAKLPPDVQTKMESSLGADFSDVRVHANSSKAGEVGALAYTQGTDIHFAPGQYNPKERAGQQLLGHELTHVVQQRQGRVSPTAQLSSGMLLNDNPELEREADALGAKAAAAPDPGPQAIQRAASKEGEGAGSAAAGGTAPVIQRMPSSIEVRNKLGEPKEHVKNPFHNRLTKKLGVSDTLKQNSTHYRAFLQKLDDFDHYVDGQLIGDTPAEINNQLNQVMTLYSEVEKVGDNYIRHNKNDEKDDKVVYIRKLKTTIPFEKTAVRSAAAEYKLDPGKKRPFWKLLTSTSMMKLSDDMSTGTTGKGGINTVTFFEIGPNKIGVFKEDKDMLRSYKEMPKEASEQEKDSADVEYMYATVDAKIDPKNAHMANRNIAMSRLDQLLGGNVIARAEFALYNSDSGIVKGSYMEKAKGQSGDKVLNPLLDEIEAGQKESFNINDPAFQRAMSRLQLLDTLAMQVDRHVGNFFIHRDSSGNVLSVTGIDNDMAFGTQTDLDSKHKEYPGLSRFVDKELAERILALKPEDLRTLMEDLLSPEEVDALIERLLKLQNHLKQKSTQLLDKDEWLKVDEKMRKGDKSYGANLDIPIYYSRQKAARKKETPSAK